VSRRCFGEEEEEEEEEEHGHVGSRKVRQSKRKCITNQGGFKQGLNRLSSIFTDLTTFKGVQLKKKQWKRPNGTAILSCAYVTPGTTHYAFFGCSFCIFWNNHGVVAVHGF
jgi:hypothetical protein